MSKIQNNINCLHEFIEFNICVFWCEQLTKEETIQLLEKDKASLQTKLEDLKHNQLKVMLAKISNLQRISMLLESSNGDYDKLYTEKKYYIMMHVNNDSDNAAATTLANLEKRAIQLKDEIVILERAIFIGKSAAASLYQVSSYLDSAASWGTLNTVGGGLIATMNKRNCMNEAQNASRIAIGKIRQLNDQLQKLKMRKKFLQNADSRQLVFS